METQITFCLRNKTLDDYGDTLEKIAKPFGGVELFWTAHSLQCLGKSKAHLCFIESPYHQLGLDACKAIENVRKRLGRSILPIVLIHPELADTIPICEDELFPAIRSVRPLNMWYSLKEEGILVQDYQTPQELVGFIRENIRGMVETLSKH